VSEHRRGVLIVDNESAYLSVLEDVCRDNGFEVETAGNARDGFQKAVVLKPGVILMDVAMPGQTGWEALQQLKSDPRTSVIPVVMMTSELIDTWHLLEPHRAAFVVLMKPIPLLILIETLERALASSTEV
jgi:CheY-like chemotaxis protein